MGGALTDAMIIASYLGSVTYCYVAEVCTRGVHGQALTLDPLTLTSGLTFGLTRGQTFPEGQHVDQHVIS